MFYSGAKILTNKLTELDKKIYKYLLKKGSNGVPQNILWREMGITSRDASRSLKKLETLKLVKREPIVFNGKKTYRIIAIKKKIDELVEEKKRVIKPLVSLNSLLDIPCMSCPYIMTICYEGGYYDPRNCQWLIDWIKNNTSKNKS